MLSVWACAITGYSAVMSTPGCRACAWMSTPGSRACARMSTPGERADLGEDGLAGAQWSRAKWATERETTDDGACYIVEDKDAPDPSKQWFFCSDPAEDDSMQCELVPEWMGTAPDGGHAVWLCSKPKVTK
mmetsp:Transcript_46114/g.151025  ORF Transcript_46114/g.151025 Transcript_46114/m.151025 type:complete len:131 (+) Transcript_46114:38-430(+)